MPARKPEIHSALGDLRELYEEVDRQALDLSDLHRARLQCRSGCSGCCVDDITVFEIEAENIRRHHGELLEKAGSAGPAGACAFLDREGACRIYADRPYVCRTQGLPLRWMDRRDGRTVEFRDICPLNEIEEQPLERLEEREFWTLGPYEAKLAGMQASVGGEPLRRVRLRDLFAADAAGEADCEGGGYPVG